MKKLFLSLMIVPFAFGLSAQDIEDADSVEIAPVVNSDEVFQRPDSVVVNRAGGQLMIQIFGAPDNPDYFYSYEQEAPDAIDDTAEKVAADDWNFNVPIPGKKKSKGRARFEFESTGIGFGFVNAIDGPQEMDVKMARSHEIFWHEIVGVRWRPTRQGASFSTGIGIDWKNYRMTGYTRFMKDGANVVLEKYAEGAEPKFSRLKLFNITLPVMFHQEFGKMFEFSVGAVVNFNTYASMMTKYMLNDEERIKRDKDIRTNKVTVDMMAMFKIEAIGVYAKYSPMSVLDTAYGPDFKSLSVGMTLLF